MEYYEPRDGLAFLENEKTVYTEKSEIQKFYTGKVIFITGGAGLLGSLLVEKLLRCCPDLGKIYLLLRGKRGKTAEERLEQLLDNEIFVLLKRTGIEYKSKVSLIVGDCEQPNCGMSEKDIDFIKYNVDIVFHIAACLSMDSHLKKAFLMNVRATKDLLEIATQMKKLKGFIHVSTAYSQSYYSHIEEKFYPPCLDDVQLQLLIDSLTDDEVGAISAKLIGPWNNTYGYTKAITESLVEKYIDKIPIVVARPSIVIGCDKEPLKGWINNIYGVTGVTTAACTGFINVWCSDKDKIADIIPADYCTNALAVIAWDLVCNRPQDIPVNERRVYNIVCDPKAQTTWGEYMDLSAYNAVRDQVASTLCVGEYYFGLEKYVWLFYLQVLLFHVPRGILLDTLLRIAGKKPQLINGFIKVFHFNLKIIPYGLKEWSYERTNYDRMSDSMSEQDKTMFYVDMSKICWKEYHTKTVRAIRLYLLKDPYDTLPKAHKKYNKIRWTRRIVVGLLGSCFFKFVCLPVLQTPWF